VHCASLGEYEQVKPILLEIKSRFPEYLIILTFFSPSGFNRPSSFFQADVVFPLPLDGQKVAKAWINTLRPSLVLFVKQELWFHYLNEMNLQKIPVFLVSGTLSSSLIEMPFYSSWYVKMCRLFSVLFLQNTDDIDLAKKYNLHNTVLAGNCRVDSVKNNKEVAWENEIIEAFTLGSDTIVFGSTWPVDIPFLQDFLSNPAYKNWKIIWAPHEISSHQINLLCSSLKDEKSIILFSKASEATGNERILLLDTLGMLKYAYRYAQLAYVGGGFGPKAGTNSIELASCLLSMKTGKPVKMNFTREQVFLFSRARHQFKHTLTTGVKKDGTLMALTNECYLEGGAYTSFGIATVYYAGSLLGAPYRLPNMKYDGYRLFTNRPAGKSPPVGSIRMSRGPSSPWAKPRLARLSCILDRPRSRSMPSALDPSRASRRPA